MWFWAILGWVLGIAAILFISAIVLLICANPLINGFERLMKHKAALYSVTAILIVAKLFFLWLCFIALVYVGISAVYLFTLFVNSIYLIIA